MSRLPSDEVVAAAVARARVDVLRTVHASRPRRSIEFRALRALAIGAVAVAALGAGTAIVFETAETQDTVIRCYEGVSLTAGYTTASDTQDGAGNAGDADPVAACQLAWALGDLGDAEPISPSNPDDFPVPPLVGCEQVNGVGAAFPNRDGLSAKELCGSLGLAVWDSD